MMTYTPITLHRIDCFEAVQRDHEGKVRAGGKAKLHKFGGARFVAGEMIEEGTPVLFARVGIDHNPLERYSPLSLQGHFDEFDEIFSPLREARERGDLVWTSSLYTLDEGSADLAYSRLARQEFFAYVGRQDVVETKTTRLELMRLICDLLRRDDDDHLLNRERANMPFARAYKTLEERFNATRQAVRV